jgi:hypothetical protein
MQIQIHNYFVHLANFLKNNRCALFREGGGWVYCGMSCTGLACWLWQYTLLRYAMINVLEARGIGFLTSCCTPWLGSCMDGLHQYPPPPLSPLPSTLTLTHPLRPPAASRITTYHVFAKHNSKPSILQQTWVWISFYFGQRAAQREKTTRLGQWRIIDSNCAIRSIVNRAIAEFSAVATPWQIHEQCTKIKRASYIQGLSVFRSNGVAPLTFAAFRVFVCACVLVCACVVFVFVFLVIQTMLIILFVTESLRNYIGSDEFIIWSWLSGLHHLLGTLLCVLTWVGS